MKKPIPCDSLPNPEVTPVEDHARAENSANDVSQLPDGADPGESIEAYETEEGVVLYDADNPLAWLQSTSAVALGDRL